MHLESVMGSPLWKGKYLYKFKPFHEIPRDAKRAGHFYCQQNKSTIWVFAHWCGFSCMFAYSIDSLSCYHLSRTYLWRGRAVAIIIQQEMRGLGGEITSIYIKPISFNISLSIWIWHGRFANTCMDIKRQKIGYLSFFWTNHTLRKCRESERHAFLSRCWSTVHHVFWVIIHILRKKINLN